MKKIIKNNKINNKKQTVFVGMSGGVDSSVSAALLKQQGFDVVGVFIRTWHPDFIECNEEDEKRDAMRVCAFLDIPFLMFDLEEEYKKGVADYMISEYKLGRTPNPDVMCNKEVKFGAFMKKALEMGADFVATGHYAQISPVLVEEGGKGGGDSKNSPPRPSGTPPSKGGEEKILSKSFDPSKDQSYFLWTLNQEKLSKILFPIGHLKKTEVRELAKNFKLPVANKKDSQGICFLGKVDLKDFLKHYIKEKKGKVLLAPIEAGGRSGQEIGYHNGAVFSTLGERHGFTITKKTPIDKPYYVVEKDIDKNILYVSQERFLKKEKENTEIKIKDLSFTGEIPNINTKYTAQVRYHGEFLPCTIVSLSEVLATVSFDSGVLVARGQSVVLYDNDRVLGGGIVV